MDEDLTSCRAEAEPSVSGVEGSPLSPADALFVPHRKRLAYSYAINEDGIQELHVDYGRKEIVFDEAHLFGFGEQLTRVSAFTGADAIGWGPGYAWGEIRPLLESLLSEGVLERGEVVPDPRGAGLVASPLPPSVCPAARYWSSAECEAITQDLASHAAELGHLEAFLPVFRVAHAALDADDRQVGEANVYPSMLRLDRNTEWRVCQYPGSRYRDEMPMNVTALKAMIKHWKPMLAALIEVRAYVAARLGIARPVWTIGELHMLSCTVLALPAYQLMKRGGETPQRPVHCVMSSLFRITDGIRMTTSDMVTSIERPCLPDAPATGADLYARSEQQGLFISQSGVCAGPKHMIDEFLAVAVDGQPANGVTAAELPAEVRDLLAELPAATDYACYGLQVWALSFSIWLAMSRAHGAVRELLETAGDAGPLLARLRHDQRAIEWKQIAVDRDRAIHLNLYVDTYAHARCVARVPVGAPQLRTHLRPVSETSAHRAATARLTGLLGGRLPERAVAPIAQILIDYVREEQPVLAAMATLLDAINALLERPRPRRPLGVRDLHLHHALRGIPEPFPYLFDSLADSLGIVVECTADTIEITERHASLDELPATASGRL